MATTTDPKAIRLVNGEQLRKQIDPITKDTPRTLLKQAHDLPVDVRYAADRP